MSSSNPKSSSSSQKKSKTTRSEILETFQRPPVILGLILALAGGAGISVFVTKSSGPATPMEQGQVPQMEKQQVSQVVIRQEDQDDELEPVVVGDVQINQPLGLEQMLEGYRVQGVTLNFKRDLDPSRKDWSSSQLSAVRFEPSIPFKGRWINERQFQIEFLKALPPGSKIELSIDELPINEKRKLKLGEATGQPYQIVMPNFELKQITLASQTPTRSIDLQLSWNYPIPGKDALGVLEFEYQGKKIDSSKIRLLSPATSEHHKISIRHSSTQGGQIQVRANGKLDVLGSEVELTQSESVDLAPAEELKLGNMTVQQSKSGFSIEIQCQYDDHTSQNQYEWYRNRLKCEVDSEEAARFVSVSPQTNFAVVSSRGKIKLLGDFLPATRYQVSVMPGLTVNGKYVQLSQVHRTVQTPDFRPQFSFVKKARYLPSIGQAVLSYEAMNLQKAKVEIRRVYQQNIPHWLNHHSEYPGENLSDLVGEYTVSLTGKKNKKIKGVLSLEKFKPQGKGVFFISVSPETTGSQYDFASVIVTNLMGLIKREKDSLRVWTRQLKDLQAQAGVQVTAISRSNRRLGICTTDASGECLFKDIVSGQFKPTALLFKSEDDFSYAQFSDLGFNDDRVHAGEREYNQKSDQLEAYVYSSRGVYRPGEKVELSALVHTGEGRPAKDLPAQWKIISPRSKEILAISRKVPSTGLFDYILQTASDFQTGKYQAQVYSGKKMIGQRDFLIEEFVPERIKVEIKNDQKHYLVGEVPQFQVAANFLFGPPVSGGDYVSKCSIVPAFSTVPKQPDYYTGKIIATQEKSFGFTESEGRLDPQGKTQTECPLSGDLGRNYPTVMYLKNTVDVREAGSGRVTSSFAKTLVSQTPDILGLRARAEGEGKLQVSGQLFDLQGTPVEREVQVELVFLKRETIYHYDYGYYGSYRPEVVTIPVLRKSGVQMEHGKFDATIDHNEHWGRFIIRARTTDGRIAEAPFQIGWFYDEESGDWQNAGRGGDRTPLPSQPGTLKMELSSLEVKPGDQIEGKFESPFAGQALVTIESDQVHQTQWLTAKKGSNNFKVTAPNASPNFYVTVLLLKNPIQNGRFEPARAWSGQSVRVSPGEREFAIKVQAAELTRGDRDLKIELKSSIPQKTSYTVAVVDEGILQLTRFKTPSPIAHFFEPRRLGVRLFETLGWTMAKSIGSPGGGEGSAATQANTMPARLVSFWSGVVESDPQGNAIVNAPLPPFQGKVRVMVVGANDQGAMSSLEKFVTVRDPIVIQPTFPRFLSSYDQIRVPISVRNMTSADGKIKVSLGAKGPVQVHTPEIEVEIPREEERVLHFPVTVEAFSGEVEFFAQATDGKTQSRDEAKVPIEPKTIEMTGVLARKADQKIQLASLAPDDMRLEEMELDVTVSTLPFLGSLGHLSQLIRYPYGCLEQTTSSTYPLLVMEDLMQWAAPELSNRDEISDKVRAGINRVASMQTSDGGFGYWQGSSQAQPWSTAYATNMLMDAQKLGYPVAAQMINGALDFLSGVVSSSQYSTPYYWRGSVEPFVLFVLAKGKRPIRKHLERLNKMIKKGEWGPQSAENFFLLAIASHLVGEKKLSESFLNRGENPMSQEMEGPRQHSYGFWSSLRSDGLRLSVLADVFPDHEATEVLTQRVAQKLMAKKGERSHWNTQEMAWAVSALGKRARTYKGVEIKNLKLAINDGELQPLSHAQGFSTWKISGIDYKKSILSAQFESSQAPYFYIRYRGFQKPEAPLPAKARGFWIDRKYLSLKGETVDPKKIKQGDLLVVQLSLNNSSREKLENLAVIDRLASGFEIENPRLGRDQKLDWVDEVYQPDYIDIRDSQIRVFGSLDQNKREDFYYIVRAVTEGKFDAPGARMELMYEPEKIYLTGPQPLWVNRDAN